MTVPIELILEIVKHCDEETTIKMYKIFNFYGVCCNTPYTEEFAKNEHGYGYNICCICGYLLCVVCQLNTTTSHSYCTFCHIFSGIVCTKCHYSNDLESMCCVDCDKKLEEAYKNKTPILSSKSVLSCKVGKDFAKFI